MQIFCFEAVTFKQDVIMFEIMEITEICYEGLVETNLKKVLRKKPPTMVTSGR